VTDTDDLSQQQPSGAGIALLRSVAFRAETAQRLESELQTTLLHSIVGATVAIFEAEAASVALYRAGTDSLEFVVAAGAQGQGVVGLSIAADQGIAGYAFTSGEPIAIAEPERDPRFGKSFSAETGYVPRSILAVPMRSGPRTTGVLEVLDKREGTFTMRDIELASVFADQAAVAIAIGARALEARDLLHTILAGTLDDDPLAEADVHEEHASVEAEIDALVSAATREEPEDDDFWTFVDAIARLRFQRPEDRSLAIGILDAVGRHAADTARRRTFSTRFRR
jgi:GAF domain-containing protein